MLADWCLLAASLALLGAAIMGSTTWARARWAAYMACCLAGAFILVAGLAMLAGARPTFTFGDVLGLAVIDVTYDALSGIFLVALGSVTFAASLYAAGAARQSGQRHEAAAFVLFLLGMLLVFGAQSVFSFLFAWELMTVASAVLVLGAARDRAVVRATYTYLTLTHIAAAALVVAFGLLASVSDGQLDFASLGLSAGNLSGPARDVVFLLLLVGFGTKAGAMPFHIWLPRAHPIAPSHVSALMSGVMIKAGIYGLIRFGFEMLGQGPEWWGLLVLGIGAASAVFGVLYALMQRDLKRLLAFSSIENIGIIYIGIGAALVARTAGLEELMSLALLAALFHALNHALFKGLLFLGAGAAISGSGAHHLDRMGGLAHVMPITAFVFGVGAAAISGVPPLNGFASEWLTFQALIGTAPQASLSPLVGLALFGVIGSLALTAGLALACFVKAAGLAFLGRARSTAAAEATEVSRTMRVAMLALALGCIAVGVAAGPAASTLEVAVEGITGAVATVANRPADLAVSAPGVAAIYVSAGIAALLVVLSLFFAAGLLRQRVRQEQVWTTGIAPEARFGYTAASFAKPIALFYRRILRPRRELDLELHPGTPYPRAIRYESETTLLVEDRIAPPLHRFSIWMAQRDPSAADRQRPALSGLHRGHAHRATRAGGALTTTAFLIVAQMGLMLAGAPLLAGIVKSAKARFQMRRGPSVWQPYRDLAKWWGKETVESDQSTSLSRLAPPIVLGATVLACLMVPLLMVRAPLPGWSDVLVVIGLLALGRFMLVLAAMDSASSFGAMGASREVAIAGLVEPGLILAVVGSAVAVGSTDLGLMAAQGEALGLALLTPAHLLAAAAFVIVAVVETGHEPFDNPDTHLELTMIHEGMLLETSGRRLAMLMYAAQLKLLLVVALFAAAFLPYGAASEASPATLLVGLLAAVGKAITAALILAALDAALAKARILALPGLIGLASLLALVGLAARLWTPR